MLLEHGLKLERTQRVLSLEKAMAASSSYYDVVTNKMKPVQSPPPLSLGVSCRGSVVANNKDIATLRAAVIEWNDNRVQASINDVQIAWQLGALGTRFVSALRRFVASFRTSPLDPDADGISPAERRTRSNALQNFESLRSILHDNPRWVYKFIAFLDGTDTLNNPRMDGTILRFDTAASFKARQTFVKDLRLKIAKKIAYTIENANVKADDQDAVAAAAAKMTLKDVMNIVHLTNFNVATRQGYSMSQFLEQKLELKVTNGTGQERTTILAGLTAETVINRVVDFSNEVPFVDTDDVGDYDEIGRLVKTQKYPSGFKPMTINMKPQYVIKTSGTLYNDTTARLMIVQGPKVMDGGIPLYGVKEIAEKWWSMQNSGQQQQQVSSLLPLPAPQPLNFDFEKFEGLIAPSTLLKRTKNKIEKVIEDNIDVSSFDEGVLVHVRFDHGVDQGSGGMDNYFPDVAFKIERKKKGREPNQAKGEEGDGEGGNQAKKQKKAPGKPGKRKIGDASSSNIASHPWWSLLGNRSPVTDVVNPRPEPNALDEDPYEDERSSVDPTNLLAALYNIDHKQTLPIVVRDKIPRNTFPRTVQQMQFSNDLNRNVKNGVKFEVTTNKGLPVFSVSDKEVNLGGLPEWWTRYVNSGVAPRPDSRRLFSTIHTLDEESFVNWKNLNAKRSTAESAADPLVHPTFACYVSIFDMKSVKLAQDSMLSKITDLHGLDFRYVHLGDLIRDDNTLKEFALPKGWSDGDVVGGDDNDNKFRAMSYVAPSFRRRVSLDARDSLFEFVPGRLRRWRDAKGMDELCNYVSALGPSTPHTAMYVDTVQLQERVKSFVKRMRKALDMPRIKFASTYIWLFWNAHEKEISMLPSDFDFQMRCEIVSVAMLKEMQVLKLYGRRLSLASKGMHEVFEIMSLFMSRASDVDGTTLSDDHKSRIFGPEGRSDAQPINLSFLSEQDSDFVGKLLKGDFHDAHTSFLKPNSRGDWFRLVEAALLKKMKARTGDLRIFTAAMDKVRDVINESNSDSNKLSISAMTAAFDEYIDVLVERRFATLKEIFPGTKTVVKAFEIPMLLTLLQKRTSYKKDGKTFFVNGSGTSTTAPEEDEGEDDNNPDNLPDDANLDDDRRDDEVLQQIVDGDANDGQGQQQQQQQQQGQLASPPLPPPPLPQEDSSKDDTWIKQSIDWLDSRLGAISNLNVEQKNLIYNLFGVMPNTLSSSKRGDVAMQTDGLDNAHMLLAFWIFVSAKDPTKLETPTRSTNEWSEKKATDAPAKLPFPYENVGNTTEYLNIVESIRQLVLLMFFGKQFDIKGSQTTTSTVYKMNVIKVKKDQSASSASSLPIPELTLNRFKRLVELTRETLGLTVVTGDVPVNPNPPAAAAGSSSGGGGDSDSVLDLAPLVAGGSAQAAPAAPVAPAAPATPLPRATTTRTLIENRMWSMTGLDLLQKEKEDAAAKDATRPNLITLGYDTKQRKEANKKWQSQSKGILPIEAMIALGLADNEGDIQEPLPLPPPAVVVLVEAEGVNQVIAAHNAIYQLSSEFAYGLDEGKIDPAEATETRNQRFEIHRSRVRRDNFLKSKCANNGTICFDWMRGEMTKLRTLLRIDRELSNARGLPHVMAFSRTDDASKKKKKSSIYSATTLFSGNDEPALNRGTTSNVDGFVSLMACCVNMKLNITSLSNFGVQAVQSDLSLANQNSVLWVPADAIPDALGTSERLFMSNGALTRDELSKIATEFPWTNSQPVAPEVDDNKQSLSKRMSAATLQWYQTMKAVGTRMASQDEHARQTTTSNGRMDMFSLMVRRRGGSFGNDLIAGIAQQIQTVFNDKEGSVDALDNNLMQVGVSFDDRTTHNGSMDVVHLTQLLAHEDADTFVPYTFNDLMLHVQCLSKRVDAVVFNHGKSTGWFDRFDVRIPNMISGLKTCIDNLSHQIDELNLVCQLLACADPTWRKMVTTTIGTNIELPEAALGTRGLRSGWQSHNLFPQAFDANEFVERLLKHQPPEVFRLIKGAKRFVLAFQNQRREAQEILKEVMFVNACAEKIYKKAGYKTTQRSDWKQPTPWNYSISGFEQSSSIDGAISKDYTPGYMDKSLAFKHVKPFQLVSNTETLKNLINRGQLAPDGSVAYASSFTKVSNWYGLGESYTHNFDHSTLQHWSTHVCNVLEENRMKRNADNLDNTTSFFAWLDSEGNKIMANPRAYAGFDPTATTNALVRLPTLVELRQTFFSMAHDPASGRSGHFDDSLDALETKNFVPDDKEKFTQLFKDFDAARGTAEAFSLRGNSIHHHNALPSTKPSFLECYDDLVDRRFLRDVPEAHALPLDNELDSDYRLLIDDVKGHDLNRLVAVVFNADKSLVAAVDNMFVSKDDSVDTKVDAMKTQMKGFDYQESYRAIIGRNLERKARTTSV